MTDAKEIAVFTPVKNENDEAATAPTVTASEPETESRENSPEGLPQHEASQDGVQGRSPLSTSAEPLPTQVESSANKEELAPLTDEEVEDYKKLTEIATTSFATTNVGIAALDEIRRRKLWRDTHPTFEAYCRDVFDFSEARASQLITHAQQCLELKKEFPDELIPTSERAIRELRRAKSAVRIKVFQKALELSGGQPPKSAHIIDARLAIEGPKVPKGTPLEEGTDSQAITPEDAVSAAELLKQFLEKCDINKLTLGNAKQIGELAKGIADIAATRGLAA